MWVRPLCFSSLQICSYQLLICLFKSIHNYTSIFFAALKCEVEFCYECSESSSSICKTCSTGYELADGGRCKENSITSTDTPTNKGSTETSNRDKGGVSGTKFAGNNN